MHKKRGISSTGITVALSALAAIGILLGNLLKLNIGVFMRFSLETMTIILAGIVFGPILGAAVGTVQDLVGCVVNGYDIIPMLTIACASIGAVSGITYRLLKRLPYTLKITAATVTAHLVGSVVLKTVGLANRYGLDFGVTIAWRILNYVIIGAVESVLLCFLLKNKQLLKQINRIVPFSTGARFKSEAEATAYAKSVSGVFSKPGLERVEALLLGIGSPEKAVKVVHVTGTNGKGSTSAMLSSIFRASGLKVGSFNSPYLIEMRESIRIGGAPISEEELTDLFSCLRPIADAMADKPTEFELLTAAAYLKFREESVDLAVIECGMGAKRDATNVISSTLCSVVTGIALDHTSYLGDTVGAIAREKAGVIKALSPLVIGDMPDEARAVITAEAERLSAPIYTPDVYTVKSASLDGTVIDCGAFSNIRIPLLGTHQPKNAALALKAATIVAEYFPTVTADAIRQGIAETVWHGRFELLSSAPVFIFDGAHNLDGVKSAVESIRTYFDTRVICLSGVLRDKEYSAMAREIATVSDTVVTVTPDSPRALDSRDYATALGEYITDTRPADTVADGVRMALTLAASMSLPVVCLGSLYLYRDVVRGMERSKGTVALSVCFADSSPRVVALVSLSPWERWHRR